MVVLVVLAGFTEVHGGARTCRVRAWMGAGWERERGATRLQPGGGRRRWCVRLSAMSVYIINDDEIMF
jgi:hypothetical protein